MLGPGALSDIYYTKGITDINFLALKNMLIRRCEISYPRSDIAFKVHVIMFGPGHLLYKRYKRHRFSSIKKYVDTKMRNLAIHPHELPCLTKVEHFFFLCFCNIS